METKQGHVLIVDDNEMNREVLSRRLERQGYTFNVAEDGARALELMRGERYDLILLDIMMPKLNGYQVLEQMQEQPALRGMPVIVISAVDELDSVVKCIELGAEDYLFKPFNPVLLKARVNAVMSRRGARGTIETTRTALSQINVEVSALLAGDAGPLTSEQQARLMTIQGAAKRVLEVQGSDPKNGE